MLFQVHDCICFLCAGLNYDAIDQAVGMPEIFTAGEQNVDLRRHVFHTDFGRAARLNWRLTVYVFF